MARKDGSDRRPTISDLAREAGVSRSTASRVISGNGYVASSVKVRVRAAADRIGYVPDAVARSLRHRATRAVGVLISDLRNPFYADVAAAVEQRLRSRGYHMILANSDGMADEEEAAATLFEASRVAGVVLAPVSGLATRRLIDAGVAVVEVDRQLAPGECDAVLVENEAGAFAATSHLLELGHRRIGLLLGELGWMTATERLAGYRAALERFGLPFDESLVPRSSFSPAEAARVTGELLDKRPDVSAIFATSNVLAEGAIAEIQRRGRRIMTDLSLIAFDDVPWMRLMQPPISAVAQPTIGLGSVAAELLLDRLDGTAGAEPVVRRLETTLILRGSTAPAGR
jgi:LacI family transcriptional regulator